MRHGLGKLGGVHSAQIQNKNSGKIKYSAGLYRRDYTGWPNQNTANPTWFDTATSNANTVTTSSFSTTLSALQTNIAYQWLGYFKPDYTGVWTFNTNSVGIDDTLTVWLGASALSGYNTSNAVLNISATTGNNTISLTAGTYYPVRIQYANNAGPGAMDIGFSHTGQAQSANWTGKIFYNSATNGF